MSTDYHGSGRVQQKQRTREHLLAAARALIEGGDTPTVDAVAVAAGISRTTAYRYFPTQARLLSAAFPETAMTSLLPDPAPPGLDDRVATVLAGVLDIIDRTESQQRAMLRLSLGDQPHELPLRQGRVIGWVREALEPLEEQLGQQGLTTLAVAIRSVCGIESRVWLTDVVGLEREELRALQLWIVQALVDKAQSEPPPAQTP